ncbi:MAG: helix-turn-helix domain-containing protein [Pseudomonadota bacterium]|nr:helix-turn-helix domain-containing protein [Pseudomonadota bacterium]
MSHTLNLDEAAKYLQLHKETLRQKVRNDEIPAAKIGRRWVFIEDDLEMFLRSHYADKWRAIQGKNLKETKLCPCIEEVTRARIGSTSQFPEDEEYENLLAPK